MKKVIAIIQARSTSKRFKGKVLKKINKLSIVQLINERLKKSKQLDDIIFCIPNNRSNIKLERHLRNSKIKVFKGPENDVLKRFYLTAKKNKANTIVRITADCPFVDTRLMDEMLKDFKRFKSIEYYSNILPATFPDGLDIEIFSFKYLKEAFLNVKDNFSKEHVTTYMRKNMKKAKNKEFKKDLSFINLSLNTKSDYKKIHNLFKKNGFNYHLSLIDLLKTKKNSKIFQKDFEDRNLLIKKISKGQHLWKKAKKNIVGGNMLLSKNPERFLPNLWPTYFKSAKQCSVTDLDNNKFIDMATMGVGTNSLGYCNKEIDKTVKKVINFGTMSTLNCPEEVYLSEKLLKIHPWFDTVKYARTGGEANAIAVRIARAASGRDNVAICGYHGWHDWYLSTNLNFTKSNNLDNHLIKGLKIKGVPKKLRNTTFSFEYGDIHHLEKLIKNKKIGVIKMEVCRSTKPNINFLKKVRQLSNKHKIVLIFDECTTGFRETFGGLHKLIRIIPDMAIFGKALGNGYAITAIVGKEKFMKQANNSFISSTFWTERIGPTAALKTLEIMQKTQSWKKITKIGKLVQKRWAKMFTKYNLDASINGIPSLSSFTFKSDNHQKYVTYITQEMLKKNILATNMVFVSISHSDEILDKYFRELKKVFKRMKNFKISNNIKEKLDSEEAWTDFRRYN